MTNIIAKTSFQPATIEGSEAFKNYWRQYGTGYVNTGVPFPGSPVVVNEDGFMRIPFKSGDWGIAGWKNTALGMWQTGPQPLSLTTVYFEEDIRFSENFPWGEKGEYFKGGKCGFKIQSSGYNANSVPDRGEFMLTSMWRSGGQLDCYLYHSQQQGQTPEHQIYYQALPGEVIKRATFLKASTQGENGLNPDGVVRVYINGSLQYERTDLYIDPVAMYGAQCGFAFFFGGDKDKWAATSDCYIDWSGVTLLDGLPDYLLNAPANPGTIQSNEPIAPDPVAVLNEQQLEMINQIFTVRIEKAVSEFSASISDQVKDALSKIRISIE